jgi:hypothetical protein
VQLRDRLVFRLARRVLVRPDDAGLALDGHDGEPTIPEEYS